MSRTCTPTGTGVLIPHIKASDPYGRPVSTSWERPAMDGIDINSPHWYDSEPGAVLGPVRGLQRQDPESVAQAGDLRGARQQYLQGGSPRAGHRRSVGPRVGPADADALVELPLQRDGPHLLGDVLREGRPFHESVDRAGGTPVRARLQDFSGRLDAEATITADFTLSGPRASEVRGMPCGRNGGRACTSTTARAKTAPPWPCGPAARSHVGPRSGVVRGLQVTLRAPADATGYWYDPRTASILGRFTPKSGPPRTRRPPSPRIWPSC